MNDALSNNHIMNNYTNWIFILITFITTINIHQSIKIYQIHYWTHIDKINGAFKL